MKSFIVLLMLAAISMADEGCRTAAPRKVVCNRVIHGVTTTAVYSLQKGGSWICKFFVPATENDEMASVETYEFGKIDMDSISIDYARWIMGGPGGKYTVGAVPDSLIRLTRAFIKDEILKGGDDLVLPGFELYLGKRTAISTMYCKGDYVRTYRHNSLTGMKTDRSDHHLDRFGTYCEDFLAKDDYFWTPPKSR